jgi:hypothetical protein
MIQQGQVSDFGMNPGLLQPNPGGAFIAIGSLSKLVQQKLGFYR